MGTDTRIVREADPRCAELEAAGYVLAGESWGASLTLNEPPDLAPMRDAVREATRWGIALGEVGPDRAPELAELERENFADYPRTPATTPSRRAVPEFTAAFDAGARVFVAEDGDRLVAATLVRPDGRADPGSGAWETDFTSVLRDYRGRGIATAVKATSIVALADDGARVFGTGGAAANVASLRANITLGYRVASRWRSYVRASESSEGPPV